MRFSIDKNLEDITEKDLKSLVKNKVPESLFLDYKRDAYGDNSTDRKELLKDVSAFANASGGELIIGIEEDEHNEARKMEGVNVENVADEITRMEQIILAGMEPKLNTFKIGYVKLSNGNYVIIVRIKQSPLYPHMVSLQNYNRFYIRKSSMNLLLDVYELRNTFLKSENILQRIRDFHRDRVSAVYSNKSPLPLREGPKLVMHIIPYDSMDSIPKHDFIQNPVELGFVEQRINFDGLLGYDMDDKGISSYCQLYRSGILEFVDSSRFIFNEVADEVKFKGQPQKVIYSGKEQHSYEYYIVKRFEAFALILKELDAQPPFYALISLIDVDGYRISYYDGYKIRITDHPVDRNMLFLPEIKFENVEQKPEHILKPAFDMIWNSCGMRGSVNYSDSCEWIGG